MPNRSLPSLERIALSMEISPQMQEQQQSILPTLQVEQSRGTLQKQVEITTSLMLVPQELSRSKERQIQSIH